MHVRSNWEKSGAKIEDHLWSSDNCPDASVPRLSRLLSHGSNLQMHFSNSIYPGKNRTCRFDEQYDQEAKCRRPWAKICFRIFQNWKWTRSWHVSYAIASLKVYRRVHIFFSFSFFFRVVLFHVFFLSLSLFFLSFFCYFSRQASRFDWLWRMASVTRTFPRISWRVYAFRTHPQERAAI